jgi:CubicO group peptidase (beta-lactamase class C family)
MKTNQKIELILEKCKSPEFSGAMLVRDDKDEIIKECNGYIDRVNEIKINIDTRFGIASGTKMFTALGIMKLVEEGKLSLEDKAFAFIENEFPMYDKRVTIKHLLTHTSGLPDYYDEDELKDGEELKLSVQNHLLKKPSDYLEVFPKKEMKFKPGEQFNYNNSAFVLLAIIIENLTGDYYEWIEKVVLEKANMKSSGFFKTNQLPKNTATGYIDMEDGTYKTNIFELPIIAGGDGGMYTTVGDMDLFWEVFLKGDIVSKEVVQEMITPHAHSENMSYGLGVWLEQNEDTYNPLLFGQDPGISFESGYHIKKKRIYTIVSNTDSGAWLLSGLLQEL